MASRSRASNRASKVDAAARSALELTTAYAAHVAATGGGSATTADVAPADADVARVNTDTPEVSLARLEFFEKIQYQLTELGLRRSVARQLILREAEVVLACFMEWLPKDKMWGAGRDEITRAARLIMIRTINRELAHNRESTR